MVAKQLQFRPFSIKKAEVFPRLARIARNRRRRHYSSKIRHRALAREACCIQTHCAVNPLRHSRR